MDADRPLGPGRYYARHVISRYLHHESRFQNALDDVGNNRPISVYRFLRRALTLCPQLCMGNQRGAHFHARSADALPATLYGHFIKAIYRNRPIAGKPYRQPLQEPDWDVAAQEGQPRGPGSEHITCSPCQRTLHYTSVRRGG